MMPGVQREAGVEAGLDTRQRGAGAEPEPQMPRLQDPEADRDTLQLKREFVVKRRLSKVLVRVGGWGGGGGCWDLQSCSRTGQWCGGL